MSGNCWAETGQTFQDKGQIKWADKMHQDRGLNWNMEQEKINCGAAGNAG